MLKMNYIGLKPIYDVEFTQISDSVLSLRGSMPAKDKGFMLTRDGYDDNWDYSKYTTIYREMDGEILYSSDGSIYVPPAPTPEPEPPSEEELQAAFDLAKKSRIGESKLLLKDYLENNPIKSTCHGGKTGTYSITEEKQTLMMSQYMTYQIEKVVNSSAILTWNETGQPCEVWTEQEFLQLILEIKAAVYPLVSKQQEYEVLIAACETSNDLDNIVIEYGGVHA